MIKKLLLMISVLAVAFCPVLAVADQIIDITGSGTYVFDGNLGSRLSGYSTGLKAQAVSPVASPEVELGNMVFSFKTGPASSIGATDTFAGASMSIGPGGGDCWMIFCGATWNPVEYDTINGSLTAPWVWGYLSPWLFPTLGLPQPLGQARLYWLTATLTPNGDGVGEIDTDFRMYIEMPEPSSIALLGSGLMIVGFLRRKGAL